MKWSSGWVLGCVVSLITMVHGVCADASLRVAPGEIDSELQESSTQELQELFDVRDHKGNRILRRKNDLEPGIWATRDPEVDGIEGTSTDRVYKK
ncbi:hypothetical protein EBZ37_12425, partial [bacterium]|nr:hypothetical protein [bacterium]